MQVGGLGLEEGSLALARNAERQIIDQRYVSGIGDCACVPTAFAMLLNDRGQWANITTLAETAGVKAPVSTDVIGLTKALKANGVGSANWSLTVTMDDLLRETARGNAAIVRMELNHSNHFVVTDGVTMRQGQAVVAVRNPGKGTQYFVPKAELESEFTGQAVSTAEKKR